MLGDIRQLIEQSRGQVAAAVNSALTMLYWHIGHRIRTEVLGSERATYGEQIVSALSRQLEADYGRGSPPKTCATCCALPKPFRRRKLSPQCGDN
jgi:hypothetical protein